MSAPWMRRLRRVAAASTAALVCGLALASCAASGDQGGPDPQLRGQWELQTATDAAGTIPIRNQLISLTIADDRTTFGRSTCSDYRARVFGSVGALWITATLPKVENCGTQIQQDIEERYINDLNQVRFAAVTGGLLDLTGPNLSLHFQRALNVPPTLVIDRNWYLQFAMADSYYGTSEPAAIDAMGATLRFNSNGTMSGTTWCSRFGAHWEQNAGEVVLSRLTLEPTSSCDESQLGVDSYVMRVIKSGFTFESENGQLQLVSPRAELELQFTTELPPH